MTKKFKIFVLIVLLFNVFMMVNIIHVNANNKNYVGVNELFESNEKDFYHDIKNEVNVTSIADVSLNDLTCEDLFLDITGNYNRTHKLLSSTLKFMQYLAVTLALVLSIVDFIKVIPTQDKEALNKSIMKAVTRVGIAILIFFVPVILNFVLELVGFNNPTCSLL